MQAQTQANYDRLSRWYDLLAGASEAAFRERALRALEVQPGEMILEIGSGTGQALVALARSVGSQGVVCGVDLSPGMCRVAAGRLRREGATGRCASVNGDALRLPLVTGGCDAVLMSFALELFAPDEMASVLAECRRVLAENGRLCVAAMAASPHPNLMTRLYLWSHRRFPGIVDCQPIPVERVLTGNGFAVVSAEHGSLWGLPVAVALARKTAPPRAQGHIRP